jgi:PLD-like domain
MFRDAKVPLRYSNSASMASGSHSKYVAISGNFHGKTNATSVYAGSLNLTASDNSICDNNMVRIIAPSAFDAYRQQFDGLWAKSDPANQSSRTLRTFTADKTAIAADDRGGE